MTLKKKSYLFLASCLLSGFSFAKSADIESKNHQVSLKVDSEHSVLHADKANKTFIKVSLDAAVVENIERKPLNICLVLDKSGSMGGDKIDQARKAAISIVKRLNKDDLFSLVTYDDHIRTLIPAQPVKNADHIIKQINAIHSGGGTALFGGVSQGAAEIRKFNNEKYLNRVFLLSDGQANVGPSTPEDLERLGISLSKENIVVTTIGLGQGYNEDLMTKLALATDSLTYFVENSNDLPRIFNKELGDVMSIVSSDIQIKVELSDGVKLIRTLGRKGSIKGNTLTFDIKHLYNGQDLFTLLEVEVPATQANSTRNLANVTLTYNNLLSQKQERSLDNVSVSFSHSDEEVIASIDKQTQSDVAEYNNAMVLAQNIQYMDQGQREQAMDNIESNIVHLKQQQSTYSNRLLSVQIIELERQRDQLNSGSYDMKMRKSMNQKSFDLWNSRKVKK